MRGEGYEKILMATNGMQIGGAETHILELSIELRRMGYDITVISKGGNICTGA